MFWRSSIWLALSFVCCSISPAQDEPREWTSDTGSTLRAALIGSETVTVYVLRKEDGTEIRVPANRLSPASRKLAEQMLKDQREGIAPGRHVPALRQVGKGRDLPPVAEGDAPNKPVIVEEIRLPATNPFLSLPEEVKSATFSPTGRHLFLSAGSLRYGGEASKGSLWDTTSWQRREPTSTECNYFSTPAVFSPDGEFVACQDGELVRIWDINGLVTKQLVQFYLFCYDFADVRVD